ncbi:NAD(P)-binding protein [Tothia fuscella]|uniref:NAD(P)-binding protein n=1 Tax=Tothia fuscella TaxID=1048955 RepID=A0A9P4NT12_9PEZI|nr:NAD(P)-binding protein [Tothia fuscella]
MSGSNPVILILGAGPNIGQAVAKTFASKGYKVALASRSLKEADNTDGQLNITSDLSHPNDVVNAFAKVKEVLGIPSVVVYNAGSVTFTPNDDPFAVPLSAFDRDMHINTTSAFVAAQQAVLGFAQLPPSHDDAAKTFLFTGNILNITSLPSFISQGAGKSASAHIIMAAASAYKDRGYKFYYVDERKEDGTAKYRVDGEAHGKYFLELAEGETQGPWLQTFVKGVGYKDFGSLYRV